MTRVSLTDEINFCKDNEYTEQNELVFRKKDLQNENVRQSPRFLNKRIREHERNASNQEMQTHVVASSRRWFRL